VSIRQRRRDRRSQPEAREDVPAPPAPVEKEEKPIMNAPKTAPIILNERDDSLIDKYIDDSTYGPLYIVSVDVARKNGNLSSKLRSGIQCPLVRVKSLATALCEMVTGGGQLRVDVHFDAGGGNRKRLLAPWWESFSDPPRIGKPYEDLTIAWDDSGGEGGEGGWVTAQRSGTGAPRAADQAPASSHGGYGFASAGGRMPDFPTPARGLGGALLPPPPHLLPPSLQTLPVDQQWQVLAGDYERRTGRRPSLEPVDIMQQWRSETRGELGEARVDKARLEEKHDSLKETSRREVEAANRKVLELTATISEIKSTHERALEKAEAKARDDKRDLEFQQLKESLKSPARTAPEPKSGGVLGGLDPAIVTAAISGFVSMQNAAAERQQAMMLAVLAPKNATPAPSTLDKIAPLAVAIAPIVTPMILQYMTNKDPEKLDALETERSLRQMQFAQMMMEQIKSLVPQEEAPPIWFPPVMALIEGMMGAVKTAAIGAGVQRLPALPPVQQQVPQQEERRVVDARVEQRPVEARPPVIEQEEEVRSDARPIQVPTVDLERMLDGLAATNADAANITRMMMRTISDRKLDPRILTPEWTSIFFEIHYRPAGLTPEQEHDRVMRLVSSIVDHLEHCREYRLLPIDLEHVFDKPEDLAPLLNLMPAFIMDREYGGMLFTECVDEIKLRERERLAAERGEPDIESGETELEGDEEEEDDEDEEDEEEDESGDQAAGEKR
jgi:hypothetical protein